MQQLAPQMDAYPIVRVMVGDRRLGSGVVVRYNGYLVLLTAAHVLDGAETFLCRTATASYQATALAVDTVYDVAICAIRGVFPQPFELAAAATEADIPKTSETYSAIGWGRPPGVLARARGQFVQFASPGHGENAYDWMIIRCDVREGDSGGPILNAAGRVIALITAGDHGQTLGPWAGRIRHNLEAARAKIQAHCQPCTPTDPAPELPLPGPGDEPIGIPAPPIPQPPQPDPCANLLQRIENLEYKLVPHKHAGIADLEERVAALQAKIDAIQLTPGPAGEDGQPGPQGPQGLQGPPGKDGKDAEIDMQALVDAVKKQLAVSYKIVPRKE